MRVIVVECHGFGREAFCMFRFFFSRIFICVFERETKTFLLPVYASDACDSQGCAKLKSGA